MSLSKTKQKGIVREYNGKEEKTPLGGVSLYMDGASSVVSGVDGRFSLSFPQLESGDPVKKFSIEKTGFEVFRIDLVCGHLMVSPKLPWEIVMRNSADFQRQKAVLKENSSDIYKLKFDASMNELQKLRMEKKLREEEFIQRLTELTANYTEQLKNLDNYIDHIARIDLSQISEDEQKVVDMVNAGRLDEAIAKYEEMDYVGKYQENMAEIIKMTKINDAMKQKKAASDKYLKGVENNINALMLAGGLENTRKARDLYESVAQTECTDVNVDWLLKTGNFVFTYFYDLEKAMDYYDRALSAAKEQFGWKSFEEARAHINIGNVLIERGNFDKARSNFFDAKWIMEWHYSPEHPIMATINNGLGIAEYYRGNIGKAESLYDDALRILNLTDSLNLKKRVSIMMNRANCYAKRKDYPKFFQMNNDVLELIGPDADDLDVMLVAGVYNNAGNALFNSNPNDDNALKFHHIALDKYESVVGSCHPDVADVCYNIGKVHFSRKEYDKALEYLNKSLSIESGLPSMRSSGRLGDLYCQAGKTYEQLGDKDSAFDNYMKGMRILEVNGEADDSEAADIYRFIADYNCDHDDWMAAVDMLCKELYVRNDLLEIKAVEDDEERRRSNLINKNFPITARLTELPKRRKLKYHEQESLAPIYERIADIYYSHIQGKEGWREAAEYFRKALIIYNSVEPSHKYDAARRRISLILDIIEQESGE